jgi:hypothetical protein
MMIGARARCVHSVLVDGLFINRAFQPFDLTPGQVFATDDRRSRETRSTASSPRPRAILVLGVMTRNTPSSSAGAVETV